MKPTAVAMSMLRTLQTNPGTISLFNSAKPATSLLSALQSHSIAGHKTAEPMPKSLWNKILSGVKGESEDSGELYLIDSVPQSQLPTFDQIKLIKSFAIDDAANLQVFKKVFPSFITADEKLSSAPVDEDDYNRLVGQKTVEWFHPPLVVDWESQKLANDIASLQQLLEKYKS